MEFYYYSPSETFVVLTADQFVARDDGLLELQRQDIHVGRGLFGIRLLIVHFKFQFSKSIKFSTFHIFLNLTYPLRKNISFPKSPKISQNLHKTAMVSTHLNPNNFLFYITSNFTPIHVYPRLKMVYDFNFSWRDSANQQLCTLYPTVKLINDILS